jgi:isochorismate hydrolase
MPSDYLDEIKQYNIRPRWSKSNRCTLLVIDMQQYFLPVATPILGNVLSLIETCRSKGMRVIFTRHGHKDISKDGGMLEKWWGDLIQYGSKDWVLINALNPPDGDGILDKNRYSAFHKTSLEDSLKSRKIEELIITGVLTNCCCETTAKDAFVRDFRVFFVSDATATVDTDLHLASLKNLAYGFAHIVSTDGLCRHLS